MKPKGQVGALIMAAYFLALPALFLFHTPHHDHESDHVARAVDLALGVEEECGACDYFFSGASFVSNDTFHVAILNAPLPCEALCHVMLDEEVSEPQDRGPPSTPA